MGRRVLASFANGVIAHSVWYFCLLHCCVCENLPAGISREPAKRSPRSADVCGAWKSAPKEGGSVSLRKCQCHQLEEKVLCSPTLKVG